MANFGSFSIIINSKYILVDTKDYLYKLGITCFYLKTEKGEFKPVSNKMMYNSKEYLEAWCKKIYINKIWLTKNDTIKYTTKLGRMFYV